MLAPPDPPRRLAAQGQVSDIEAHAELYRGVYSMTDRYLIFARDVLLRCAVLSQLLACSTVLLRLRDREALAQVRRGDERVTG